MKMTEAEKVLAENGVRYQMASVAVKAFGSMPGTNEQREAEITSKLDISARTLRHWMGRGPTRVMDFAALMAAMGCPVEISVPGLIEQPEPAKPEATIAAELDKAIADVKSDAA